MTQQNREWMVERKIRKMCFQYIAENFCFKSNNVEITASTNLNATERKCSCVALCHIHRAQVVIRLLVVIFPSSNLSTDTQNTSIKIRIIWIEVHRQVLFICATWYFVPTGKQTHLHAKYLWQHRFDIALSYKNVNEMVFYRILYTEATSASQASRCSARIKWRAHKIYIRNTFANTLQFLFVVFARTFPFHFVFAYLLEEWFNIISQYRLLLFSISQFIVPYLTTILCVYLKICIQKHSMVRR